MIDRDDIYELFQVHGLKAAEIVGDELMEDPTALSSLITYAERGDEAMRDASIATMRYLKESGSPLLLEFRDTFNQWKTQGNPPFNEVAEELLA